MSTQIDHRIQDFVARLPLNHKCLTCSKNAKYSGGAQAAPNYEIDVNTSNTASFRITTKKKSLKEMKIAFLKEVP